MGREEDRRQPTDNENSNREIKDEFSLSWLVVFCLLSPYLTINHKLTNHKTKTQTTTSFHCRFFSMVAGVCLNVLVLWFVSLWLMVYERKRKG